MHARISMFAILGLLLAACGGGIHTHEDAMEAQIDLMEDMVEILKGVTDEASAKKAEPKMEALGKRAMEIAQQVQKLPQPDLEEMKKVQEKHAKRLRELQQEAAGQMMKLMQYPGLADATGRAMTEMR
jgi:hypothetical protein